MYTLDDDDLLDVHAFICEYLPLYKQSVVMQPQNRHVLHVDKVPIINQMCKLMVHQLHQVAANKQQISELRTCLTDPSNTPVLCTHMCTAIASLKSNTTVIFQHLLLTLGEHIRVTILNKFLHI